MSNKFIGGDGEILNVVDGFGPLSSHVSVVNRFANGKEDGIELVIGARFEDRQASLFSKKSLGELIDILSQIQKAMK